MSIDYALLEVQRSELRAAINMMRLDKSPTDDSTIKSLIDLDAMVTYIMRERDKGNYCEGRLGDGESDIINSFEDQSHRLD